MTYIPGALRRIVYERAGGRCEYCLLHEEDCYMPHVVDLIFAEKHGGEPVVGNLCLSCVMCSLHKGADLASLDVQSSELAQIYHPRLDRWDDHFRFDGALVEPLTPKGRATVRLLHMNDHERVLERGALIKLGRLPERRTEN